MRTLLFIIFIISVADAEPMSSLEMQLLDKYSLIENIEFTKECLNLSQKLKLKKLKDCQILNTDDVNAFVMDRGVVYLTYGLMQLLNNEDQWASVLAHENAHLELNHYAKRLEKIRNPGFFFTKSRLKKFIKKQESEADQWADKRLHESGFDPMQVAFFLSRVEKKSGNAKSDFHLKLKKRAELSGHHTENRDENFRLLVKSYLADSSQ